MKLTKAQKISNDDEDELYEVKNAHPYDGPLFIRGSKSVINKVRKALDRPAGQYIIQYLTEVK